MQPNRQDGPGYPALPQGPGKSQPPGRSRLSGLPCPKCGSYYYSDEPSCPVCEGQRATSSRLAMQDTSQCPILLHEPGRSQPAKESKRLYGLPCAKCGCYYYSDEPSCPICSQRMSSRPPRSM